MTLRRQAVPTPPKAGSSRQRTPESNDAFTFTRNTGGKVDGLKMYTMEGSYDRSEKAA